MKKTIISITFAVALMVSCLAGFGLSINAAEPADISSAVVSATNSSYTYTGSAIEPSVTVKLTTTDEGGNPKTVTLVNNTDYKAVFSNNVNAGEGAITVTGVGAYKGSAKGTFTIAPKSLSDSNVKIRFTEKSKVGRAPSYTVTYNGMTLKKNRDYSVDFTKLDKAGYKTGRARFKGIGNYSGSSSEEFSVYPTIVKGIKVDKVQQNSISLSWNTKASEGVSGYKVYKADDANGKNAKLLATVKSPGATLSDVDSATVYRLFVIAYKTNNDHTVKSDFSAMTLTCTKPKKPTLNYVVKKKGNKIYANWTGVYNASGYQIKYAANRKLKNAKKTNAKGSRSGKNIKVADNGIAYFVKIRAYKTYTKNGKKVTVYGPWSVKMSSIFGRVYKSYTTNYPYNPNRTTNLKLACKAIDGTIVNPGATFSFNATVGKRTAAKGYKPATIFTGANSHADGIGGGVCQVATTMFNAALLSNFKIVERHQHSQKVTYAPTGRDSAIFWGSEDFKFKNTTKYPIKIRMFCNNGKLTCQFMVSYKIKPAKVSLNVARNGKNYTLTRTVGGKVNYTTRSNY